MKISLSSFGFLALLLLGFFPSLSLGQTEVLDGCQLEIDPFTVDDDAILEVRRPDGWVRQTIRDFDGEAGGFGSTIIYATPGDSLSIKAYDADNRGCIGYIGKNMGTVDACIDDPPQCS